MVGLDAEVAIVGPPSALVILLTRDWLVHLVMPGLRVPHKGMHPGQSNILGTSASRHCCHPLPLSYVLCIPKAESGLSSQPSHTTAAMSSTPGTVMHESAAQELVAMVDKPISPGRPSFLKHEYSMNEISQKLVQSPLVTSAGFTEDQVGNNDCRRLFHQLSRPLPRSILLQTVGVDNYKMICDPERAGGVYLAGLYVEKRQGRFITDREMAGLIEKLKKYKEAIEVYDKRVQNGRIRQSTRRQKVALELARAFDDASKGRVSLPFARPLLKARASPHSREPRPSRNSSTCSAGARTLSSLTWSTSARQ